MFLSRGVTVHMCTYVCTLACILTDWMKGFLSILLYYVFFLNMPTWLGFKCCWPGTSLLAWDA